MNGDFEKPAGYARLIHQQGLATLQNCHESSIGTGGGHRIEAPNGAIREVYPPKYWPGEEFGDHLEFALKYDGTNLLILSKLFAAAAQNWIVDYIRSKPTGKYARRIWYLYELLTKNQLPLDDLKQGNYVDLLEPAEYYTTIAIPVARQRIRDNLLGDARFCPMVRRTQRLAEFETSDLAERCRKIIAQYPVTLLKRALAYLYTKESKSSFAIEHIKPSANRTERFVALLQLAEREDFFRRTALIDLQNRIVDERFQNIDYRVDQNYVGEAIAWQNERVHFVSPKPEDLGSLMDGMIASHGRMRSSTVHPVVHAAAVAYGFVFMHPFDDGNGRIHRFLIHNVLAARQFIPRGIMFPVSAVMLNRMDSYDASLESFSKALMPFIDFELDNTGRMTVRNDTAEYYRYIDFTPQAEALFNFIRETIDVELVGELRFLINYDATKRAIQEVVDMPDRLIDLFIRLCLQNHGKLSKGKRDELFRKLTDGEIARMEEAVAKQYEPI